MAARERGRNRLSCCARHFADLGVPHEDAAVVAQDARVAVVYAALHLVGLGGLFTMHLAQVAELGCLADGHFQAAQGFVLVQDLPLEVLVVQELVLEVGLANGCRDREETGVTIFLNRHEAPVIVISRLALNIVRRP